jgi:Chitin synthase export chaperone
MPLVCTVIYIISQLILVSRMLDDRWPIGDIVFSTAFFTIAQVLLFAFNVMIGDSIAHYIDGLFFSTLCMLLSVMMVYKDSITVRLKFSSEFLMLKLLCPPAGVLGVFSWLKSFRLEGQGSFASSWYTGRTGLFRERYSEQLPWWTTGESGRQPQQTTAVLEGRVRTWLPTVV